MHWQLLAMLLYATLPSYNQNAAVSLLASAHELSVGYETDIMEDASAHELSVGYETYIMEDANTRYVMSCSAEPAGAFGNRVWGAAAAGYRANSHCGSVLMVSMSSRFRPQSGPVSRSDVARSTCSVSLRS